ncbi:MAG: KTSC domain-containing protein [Kiritimatiellia bacterium]
MKLIHVLSIVTVVSVALVSGCSKGAPEQTAPEAAAEAVSTDAGEGFVAIDSSLLEKVKYDSAAQTLTVVFDSGETYVYSGVPQTAYDELMAAPSKGAFFEAGIKNTFKSEKK